MEILSKLVVGNKVCKGTVYEEIKSSTSNNEGDQVGKKSLSQVLLQVLAKYSIKYTKSRTALRRQVRGAT